ncbi:probable serine/threonine-protein kinase kinX [Trichomycterus rosablanca]|uniref:probable serine/threonine-protein kinase kinX n=1 Tax=Trichomycterus rosablanca TaxID=2290929 RepID=UPI002F35619F
MDCLWTWFPIRRRSFSSPAEPETPDRNKAKEEKNGKKKWKNIFSRNRKPKDAGKLLTEGLEGQGPQQPEGVEGLELHFSLEDPSADELEIRGCLRFSSLAEPETPDRNEAKEKKNGKKKWKNIFSRNRKPKDAGKLLKEALEGQGPQQPEGVEGLELHFSLEDPSADELEIRGCLRFSSLAEPETPDRNEAKEKKNGKKKWKNIFSRNRKPKDAGKLLKEALEGQGPQQPEGDEGLELHFSLEDTSADELEIRGCLRFSSLAEPEMHDRNEAKEKKNGKKKWKNIFSRNHKPKDAGKLLKEALEGQGPQQPEGDEGLELHSMLEDTAAGLLGICADTKAGALKKTSLDETRGDTEIPLPVEELESEAEALKNISLDETRDISLDEARGDTEIPLPVEELESEAEALENISLDEIGDDAEMLLPVEELDAEAEALENISLDEGRDDAEMLLPVRELEAEAEALNNIILDETRADAEMLLPVEELDAEAEALNNISLDEGRDDAEMLLPVRELEADAEALENISLDEGRDDAEMLLPVRELEAEAKALKPGKKTRRGTRGRGRKINYKKNDNKESNIINEVNVKDEAEAEVAKVAEIKKVHLDEKDSTADLLNPDQPLGEERNEWMGRGDTENTMIQKKKIRRGTRGRGRKIDYKKDASEAQVSASGSNH